MSALGAGGMGEVYRACDTRLNRDVALKVLPTSFALDQERLARFRREAQVLAALNHPNIASIYGLEETNGTQALVLELVEGPTLADRIAEGPIAVEEALPIARQIAEALETAHEQGIIHRDLKPANIKVRADGTVKVLDFGLAKAVDPHTSTAYEALTNSPTVPPSATIGGVVLGTAAYMSPEQAQGKPVDRRADIWAFGCVLFEMLTGRRAFRGDTIPEILANVLKSEPEWHELPAETPTAIHRVLRRCLTREVQKREPHIGSARLDIQEGADAHTEAPPRSGGRGSRALVAAAAVAMVSVTGLLLLFWGLHGSSSDHSVEASRRYQTSVLLPDGVRFSGIPSYRLALSPDGTRLAFVASSAPGRSHLYVRPLDAADAQLLAGTKGASAPFWSPDGKFIGYFSAGKLMKTPAQGGTPLAICEYSGVPTGAHWGSNGDILYSSGGPGIVGSIRRVASSGGVSAEVLKPDRTNSVSGFWWPSWLPDGEHVLYFAIGPGLRPLGIYVASLITKEKKLLMEGGSNVKFANGSLLFLRDQTLFAQTLDLERLELVGAPSLIAEGVVIGGNSGATGAYAVSNNGTLAYQATATRRRSQLVWFDRTGNQLTSVGEPDEYGDLELSPDGTRLSVSLPSTSGTRDIWLIDLKTSQRSRLTFDAADEQRSIWSPDGSRVIFNSNRQGVLDLYEQSSSGGAAERLVFADGANKIPLSWSPDGRHVLVGRRDPATGDDIWVLPLGGGEPYPFLKTTSNERAARFSPDGRWVSYTSDESVAAALFITPFPGPGGKWQVSSGGVVGAPLEAHPQWRPDGNELFYIGGNLELMSASIRIVDGVVKAGNASPLFRPPFGAFRGNPYVISKDGTKFVVNSGGSEGADNRITLVVNWPSLVKN